MIDRARTKGLAAIGFADHFAPRPIPGCPFYDQQGMHIVRDLRAEIAQIPDTGDIEILVGIETDYTLAGRDCLPRAVLRRVDHVICASSHFHLPGAPRPETDMPRSKAELILRTARESLILDGVSVWAHPFDCSRMRPLAPMLDTVSDDELAALIASANEHEVAIEVNGGAAQHADYRQATERFFVLARDMGARFTLTADAHHPDDFARLDLAVEWARGMGLEDAYFLTAHELLERQGRKRARNPAHHMPVAQPLGGRR
jgi:histidinol phosphatase-like PHP family hydrolase